MPPSILTADDTVQVYGGCHAGVLPQKDEASQGGVPHPNSLFGWQLRSDFQREDKSAFTLPDSLIVFNPPTLLRHRFIDKG